LRRMRPMHDQLLNVSVIDCMIDCRQEAKTKLLASIIRRKDWGRTLLIDGDGLLSPFHHQDSSHERVQRLELGHWTPRGTGLASYISKLGLLQLCLLAWRRVVCES
jgi:hypothetical protein